MTRKLIYTQDVVGEYTIADETEKWVTIVGQVETESDAILFCAAPELLEALLDLEARACIYVNTSKAKAAIAKALGESK